MLSADVHDVTGPDFVSGHIKHYNVVRLLQKIYTNKTSRYY